MRFEVPLARVSASHCRDRQGQVLGTHDLIDDQSAVAVFSFFLGAPAPGAAAPQDHLIISGVFGGMEPPKERLNIYFLFPSLIVSK